LIFAKAFTVTPSICCLMSSLYHLPTRSKTLASIGGEVKSG